MTSKISSERSESLKNGTNKRNYNIYRAEQMVAEDGITMDQAKEKISDFVKCEEKAKKVAQEIEVMKNDINTKDKKDYYCQRAFVTFDDQDTADRAVRKWKMFWLIRIFLVVFSKCCKVRSSKRMWEGKRVVVERATEPGDVYWENLSVSDVERFFRQGMTYLITALALGAAFGIYYGFNRLGRHLEDNAGDDATSSDLWLIRIVNLLASITTMVVNILLDIMIRLLSSFEKHRSYTKYHLSVAIKLMASTFINSALLPFFNNLDSEYWFTNNGLAMTIFYNSVSVAFVSTIMYFFNIGYVIKRLRICWEIRKGAESKMTQRQANELFEGPKVDMAMLYARTGMLYLLICFYTPLVPGIAIVGAIGIFLQYWIEKYLLLRRHRVPEAMGSAMAKFYSGLIPLGMLLYSIGNSIFVYELSNEDNNIGYIGLWVMVAYYVLPIGFILSVFAVKVKRDSTLKYKDAKFGFVQDYDRENPMTENAAKAEYLEEMKDRVESKEEQEEIDRQIEKNKHKNNFKALNKYGKNRKGLERRSSGGKKYRQAKGRSKKTMRKFKRRPKRSNIRNNYMKRMNKKFNKNVGNKKKKDPFGNFEVMISKPSTNRVIPAAPVNNGENQHNESEAPMSSPMNKNQ